MSVWINLVHTFRLIIVIIMRSTSKTLVIYLGHNSNESLAYTTLIDMYEGNNIGGKGIIWEVKNLTEISIPKRLSL